MGFGGRVSRAEDSASDVACRSEGTVPGRDRATDRAGDAPRAPLGNDQRNRPRCRQFGCTGNLGS